MMETFFIADPHFSDDNIRRYENRPFESTDEMDKTLIRLWNENVRENDEVFVLGDFGAHPREKEVLSVLHGKKYLVKGNHDTQTDEYYRNAGFAAVYDMPVIYKGFWILSHEAVYENRNMPYANIFGHVHGNPMYKNVSCRHYLVSAERTGYAPVSFRKIVLSVKEADEKETSK